MRQFSAQVGKWAYSTTYADDIPTPMGSRDEPWRLQDDECCVLGDFGSYSADSRQWGAVPMASHPQLSDAALEKMVKWVLEQ